MTEKLSLPDTRRGDWLTVKQLAGVFGVTVQGFRTSYLPDISPGDIQQGKPLRVFAPAAIALHVARAVRRLGGQGDDLGDGGPASPSLERWRAARAQREEIELLHRLRELGAISTLRSGCLELVGECRQFAERQIKTFGTICADDWSETCERIDASIGQKLKLDFRRRELHVWPSDDSRQPIVVDLSDLGTEGIEEVD